MGSAAGEEAFVRWIVALAEVRVMKLGEELVKRWEISFRDLHRDGSGEAKRVGEWRAECA